MNRTDITFLPATIPGADIFNRAAAEGRDLTPAEVQEINDICDAIDANNRDY